MHCQSLLFWFPLPGSSHLFKWVMGTIGKSFANFRGKRWLRGPVSTTQGAFDAATRAETIDFKEAAEEASSGGGILKTPI